MRIEFKKSAASLTLVGVKTAVDHRHHAARDAADGDQPAGRAFGAAGRPAVAVVAAVAVQRVPGRGRRHAAARAVRGARREGGCVSRRRRPGGAVAADHRSRRADRNARRGRAGVVHACATARRGGPACAAHGDPGGARRAARRLSAGAARAHRSRRRSRRAPVVDAAERANHRRDRTGRRVAPARRCRGQPHRPAGAPGARRRRRRRREGHARDLARVAGRPALRGRCGQPHRGNAIAWNTRSR